MIKVDIVGASGYTGGELIRLLLNHPSVEIGTVTSRKFDNLPIEKVHHNIRNSGLVFKNTLDLDGDLAFTATPHGASMKIIPGLVEKGLKVIDLSGDYRFEDTSIYEKWYGIKHSSDLKAVYGLPEINRKAIKKADLIANPGCFPTGAILSSYPLIKENLVDRIIIDSKTGVSGAGVEPSAVTHYPKVADNVTPYKIDSHRHMAEIQQGLNGFDKVKVSFTPHLVPVIRGIQTTSHSILNKENESLNSIDLIKYFEKYYKNEFFISLLEEDETPYLSSVKGSNFVHIGGFKIDETGRIIILSVIDNLVKGASGQAIQNMNIMENFKEEEGIDFVGLSP